MWVPNRPQRQTERIRERDVQRRPSTNGSSDALAEWLDERGRETRSRRSGRESRLWPDGDDRTRATPRSASHAPGTPRAISAAVKPQVRMGRAVLTPSSSPRRPARLHRDVVEVGAPLHRPLARLAVRRPAHSPARANSTSRSAASALMMPTPATISRRSACSSIDSVFSTGPRRGGLVERQRLVFEAWEFYWCSLVSWRTGRRALRRA